MKIKQASESSPAGATAPAGLLLVNLGTPDGPNLRSVRRYLRVFLMDKRVMDVPGFMRFLLVHGMIVPFRGRASTREYKKLWDQRGSPLNYHTQSLTERLQTALGEGYVVRYAMRYQKPSLKKVLSELQAMPLSRMILVPLFPQYASATTGSVIEAVLRQIRRWSTVPSLYVMSQFHLKDEFLAAWAAIAEPYLKEQWDAFLFSYHGLPERQIHKNARQFYCQLGSCCEGLHPANQYCYRAQCFQSTAALAAALRLPEERCITAFQSRLGRAAWLQPYTENILPELAAAGKRSVLVFSPSFVADCLETQIEIAETYKERFLKHGGQRFQLVPGLNDSPRWVVALKKWAEEVPE